MWNELIRLGQVLVAGKCDYGNEHSRFAGVDNFLSNNAIINLY
jgi:hypothetical protein